MKTNREKAILLLNKMLNTGVSESMILDYLVNDHLTGQEAYDAMVSAEKEFFQNEDEVFTDRDHDASSFDEED